MGRRTRAPSGTPAEPRPRGGPALRVVEPAHDLEDKIQEALNLVAKKYGAGALGTVRGKHGIRSGPVDVVSTGSLSIDLILGIGGLPRGRVIEIYGAEAGGKTTLSLQVVAQAQKLGGLCAFIDAEHALDPDYATRIGVNCDSLLLSQPDYGEQALEIADTLFEVKPAVIVIDSVAALVPKAELDGEMGDQVPGSQARMMSQALRKITARAAGANTMVIFINQLREKIMTGGFGTPETTTGGKALKFYASVRLDVRRIGSVKRGEAILGNRVKVKVAKHKLAPPFRTCELDLVFGQGFDTSGEILDFGVTFGIIKKAGAWYTCGEDKLGQGRAFVADLIMTPPYKDLREQIVAEVKDQHKTPVAQPAGESEDEEEDNEEEGED